MKSQPMLSKIAQSVEDARILDKPGAMLRTVAEFLTVSNGVRRTLTGQTSGSPLHPAMVHLPIGAAISAAVLDLAGGEDLEGATTALTALTVASAVPTVATGLADYTTKTGTDVRRVAYAHAFSVMLGTKLIALSWVLRALGVRGPARATLLGGVASYAVGGFFGGHIVHVQDQPAPTVR